ncbi:hypothetical protein F511_17522 [Dorcoceras hygrometricum]|uniref:Uncharacterized protein n=1 Tax=Dorcoceras hygrometricum TaxID=472368 RepID=A0A2Z7CST3_9LAMI|nr:hypothetical protein F511_17522 [Dorcoceras hygrometricum]
MKSQRWISSFGPGPVGPVGGEEITDSPKLKKTPAKKAVSLKRPAVDTAVAPVVKRKRTTKGKPVAMETVAVAQEAVLLQIFEATADAPVEQSPVPKRKIQKRKRRLVLETDDEINVEKQPAVENMDEQVGGPADDSIDEGTVIGNVANVDDPKSSEKEPVDEPVAGQQEVVPVVEASTDDPDTIIEQDIMAQLDAERTVFTASDIDEEMEQVDVFIEISTAGRTVGTDADAETMDFEAGVRDQQVQTFVEDPADEEMSCDGVEITKITMGKEIKIPGVDERTWHLASLPQIKVIAMLSDLHLFVLEELKEQAIAHGLTWTKTCCSKIFEGHTRDRGAVIARINTSTQSKCWIRTMIRVDGVWAVEPCADHWVKIPRPVVLNEVPRQCSYVDTLPTVISATPRVQLLDEHPLSASTSEDSAMNFDEIDTAATSTSLPAASIPKITEALAQLRASIEQISERDDGAKHKDTLLLHLHEFERKFTARFDAQERVLGALRKDSNDQRILMSLDLKSSHKQLGTQIATTSLDVVDVRRVVREHYQELNAKITSLYEQVAATRNDLLEFSAQAQQTLNLVPKPSRLYISLPTN